MPSLTDETPETVSRRFEDARNSSPFFERESFGASLWHDACTFKHAVCATSFLNPRE